MLKSLVNLLPPSARVQGRRTAGERIEYIPQDVTASLSPFLRVRDQMDPQAEPLLHAVGLGDPRIGRSYPHQLSGGEKQRVLIAQALAGKANLILADEPTANLDPAAEELVVDLLAKYVRENGAGMLIASHRERVFRRLGCRVHRMTPAGGVAPRRADSRERTPVVVEVRRLSKTYQTRDWLLRHRPSHRALSNVSLAIHEGETLSLRGPSGSGKSTLAKCLAGLLEWDSGTVEWKQGAAGVQIVAQEPSESLNPRFTIGDCLREATGAANPELLERVSLPGSWLGRKVYELSEGQRARVAIARTATALRQGLLILDESLTGLDAVTRRQVLTFLSGLQAKTGIACLLITHDAEVAEEAASRVVLMEKGGLAA